MLHVARPLHDQGLLQDADNLTTMLTPNVIHKEQINPVVK